MHYQQVPTRHSLTQSSPVSVKSTPAWIAIQGFVIVTVLGLLAGLGGVLNLLFPALALAVGLFLYLRYPILYIGFTWWIYFLTPFIRRVADFRSGFTDPSPMLLAPPLVAMVTVITFYRQLPRSHYQGGLPFVLSAIAVLYGFLVGLINGSPVAATISLLVWISPVLFGFHVYVNWRYYPDYCRTIRTTFLWGVLITATYGIYQYLVAPEWDRFWLVQTELYTSMGSPEPQGMRVWSTMNSPLNFATVLIPGTLLLFTGQGILRIPALTVGILALLLTLVRTAWGGWIVGVLTLISSLKGLLQVRLVAFMLAMLICIIPLATVEPFSNAIQSRITSISSVQTDQSARDRQQLYGRMLDSALSEVVGKGNGTLEPIDSGILEILLTLGWIGTIPYLGGVLVLVSRLLQGAQVRTDSFASVAHAVTVGCLPMMVGSNAMIGISGLVFWSFLSLGIAAQNHHRQAFLSQS